jgi:hypothetical protein
MGNNILAADMETLWAVVVGAVLATVGGFAATQLEQFFRRRERRRSAALLFGEILSVIELITALADDARGRGDPYGQLTMRLLRAVRREADAYDRNREQLYDLPDAKLRAQIHALMVRVTLTLDGVFDTTAEIVAAESVAKALGVDDPASRDTAAAGWPARDSRRRFRLRGRDGRGDQTHHRRPAPAGEGVLRGLCDRGRPSDGPQPEPRQARMSDQGPLSDLKVVEMGQLIAGPFCGQLLGDMGAEVVKIEPPGAGDPMRVWGQGAPVWWEVIARNKLSVSLNLRVAQGQALARRLIGEADVLIENFKPGTLEGWNLAPDDLRREFPRLIVVRMSGYGQTGRNRA